MKTLQIAKFFGIPVKLHYSFAFIFLYIAYISYTYKLTFDNAIFLSAMILTMFVCVVLHEYGHALVALKFGIKTEDIILSPIGGVARLYRNPEKPKEEFLIAIAGPLVNVAIALLLFLTLWIIGQSDIGLESLNDLQYFKISDFLGPLIYINVILFLFNLAPAFPMDGGRILRALLSIKMDRLKATKIASIIGRVLAVVFIILGLYTSNYIWAFIGVFIFTMARVEYQQLVMSKLMKETVATDLVRRSFTKIYHSDDYGRVIEIYKRGVEKNFLVFDQDDFILGSIPELFIKKTIKEKDLMMPVVSRMSQQVTTISNFTMLDEIIKTLKQGIAIVGVTERDVLIGVIDRNIVMDFMKMRT
ncbi:MAG TPA: site-2 protease family protein [Saprospiraceae bacterium]|nr:site-2 protease family protein [Saprospiraceae bacterium]HPK09030.1 site-2 protease family protein [Saprospiraceae bacterium]HPQ21853.1 site-2 protease family protein [Saprospiraceae bacterium]